MGKAWWKKFVTAGSWRSSRFACTCNSNVSGQERCSCNVQENCSNCQGQNASADLNNRCVNMRQISVVSGSSTTSISDIQTIYNGFDENSRRPSGVHELSTLITECLPATCYCVASVLFLLFGLVTLVLFTTGIMMSEDNRQWASTGQVGSYLVIGLGTFCFIMVLVIIVMGRRRAWSGKRRDVAFMIREGVELREATSWSRQRPTREHRFTPHPRFFHQTRLPPPPPSPSPPPPDTPPPPTYEAATAPPAYCTATATIAPRNPLPTPRVRPWLPPPQFAALPPGSAIVAETIQIVRELPQDSTIIGQQRQVVITMPLEVARGTDGEEFHRASAGALLDAKVTDRFLYGCLRLPTLPGGARRVAPEVTEIAPNDQRDGR